MNKTVVTVTGPVSPDSLGTTLIHEHVTFAYPGWYADESLAPYNRNEAERVCLKVLEDVKRSGVKTIVDATAADVGGRDPILLKSLSGKVRHQHHCSNRSFPGKHWRRQLLQVAINDERAKPRRGPLRYADWHPDYLFRRLVPKLKRAGVTDEQIAGILVDNPRKFLGGA